MLNSVCVLTKPEPMENIGPVEYSHANDGADLSFKYYDYVVFSSLVIVALIIMLLSYFYLAALSWRHFTSHNMHH